MTSLAERLARPEILALPRVDIAANPAMARDIVKLDSNENGYPPLVTGPLAGDINRYPDPQALRLTARMAALYGVAPDAVVVTRGADDAIDALVRTFCRAGEDAVACCPPTFGQYAQAARIQGARVLEVPLTADFALDEDALIDAVRRDGRVKLVFLCSPNNPTGDVIAPETVRRVAAALPDTLIVLDEAYVEFAAVDSMAREAIAGDNLVVLRTLSKAYGLAGARIGALVGPATLTAIVTRVLPPYALPSPSLAAALDALAPTLMPIHAERIAAIIAYRARLAALLRDAGGVVSAREGGANFLLLDVADPAALARRADAAGVLLRFRPQVAPGAVRATIGTSSENAALLALFGLAAERANRTGQAIRQTKETRIAVAIDLDRAEPRSLATGIPFYDHMLDQVAAHAGFSLILQCEGDLDIDAHHSIEDCAIAFGSALSDALGARRGIGRFGFSLPMDETQAEVLIDLSGRPYAKFDGDFTASHIGAYPTEMTRHVFRSFADSLGAALHVRVAGDNDHHKTEACYKAFGRALRQAVRAEGDGQSVPSTKGVL